MSNNLKSNKPFIFFLIMLGFVIFLWFFSYFSLRNDTQRGNFGDMFGAVNALFSGLAFAGLIYAILLQKEELELQRNEIKDTRLEFITQNNTLKNQKFENTFFSMLELHHKIVNGIDIIDKERVGSNSNYTPQYQVFTINGRDVFKKEYLSLIDSFKNKNRSFDQESIDKIYLEKYEDVQTDFGHYFRNVYRIIKIIDSTDFFPLDVSSVEKNKNNFEEKYKYTSILRAQLSDYEILWLFYNCLSSNGNSKFKQLIEKYTIFKNIPKNKLYNIDDYKKYEEGAYEKH